MTCPCRAAAIKLYLARAGTGASFAEARTEKDWRLSSAADWALHPLPALQRPRPKPSAARRDREVKASPFAEGVAKLLHDGAHMRCAGEIGMHHQPQLPRDQHHIR